MPQQQLFRHAATVVRRRSEAANISASVKTFHCYDIVRQLYRADMASLACDHVPQVALGKLAMKTCRLQQGFVTWKIYQEASADMQGQKITFKPELLWKLLEVKWYILTLNEQRRLNISVHNANVRENLEILKELINVNCFLAKQQLAFCSNNETSISSNRGNYVELLHTLAAKDERLARHLETSTVFSYFSNIIQNDLIAAIGGVVRYDIKEISAAPFVAAEVDESTDVTNKAQISVIVWLKARWLVKWRKRAWDLVRE